MKRLISYIFMLLAMLGLSLSMPMEARADFAEQPIAYVVLDHSGEMDGATYKDFRTVVKLPYHFPQFQLVEAGKAQELVTDLVKAKKKLTAESLAWAAEQAQVEGIVVLRIYEMDQRYVPYMGLRRDDELVRTAAVADMLVYRKTGNKFQQKKLREVSVKPLGEADAPQFTIKWTLSRLLQTFEGKEVI